MTTHRNDRSADAHQYFRYVNEVNILAIFNMLDEDGKDRAKWWPYLFIYTANCMLFMDRNLAPGSRHIAEIQQALESAEIEGLPNEALYTANLGDSYGAEVLQDYSFFLGRLRRVIGSTVEIKPKLSLAASGS